MKFRPLIALLLLSSCAVQNEQSYCDSFHIARESTDYAECRAYYAKMEQWFAAEASECQGRATSKFPEYMYDHPRYANDFGIDRYGVLRDQRLLIEPDYVRNNSLDMERRKIYEPCMKAKGWLSADSWQAGRINSQPKHW